MENHGTIVFWNGKRGIIRDANNTTYPFFRNTVSDSAIKDVRLLAQFNFETRLNHSNGKEIAFLTKCRGYVIPKVKEAEFIHEHKNLVIAKVKSWDGRKGILESEALEDDVFLFHTRLHAINVIPGQYLIIHPVVSRAKRENDRNFKDLFADYALPLEDGSLSTEVWDLVIKNHLGTENQALIKILKSKDAHGVFESSIKTNERYEELLKEGRVDEAFSIMRDLWNNQDEDYLFWISRQSLSMRKYYWQKDLAPPIEEDELVLCFLDSPNWERSNMYDLLSAEEQVEILTLLLTRVEKEQKAKASNDLYRFILMKGLNLSDEIFLQIKKSIGTLSGQDKLRLFRAEILPFEYVENSSIDTLMSLKEEAVGIFETFRKQNETRFYQLIDELIDRILYLTITDKEWELQYSIIEGISSFLFENHWKRLMNGAGRNLSLVWLVQRSEKAIVQPSFAQVLLNVHSTEPIASPFYEYLQTLSNKSELSASLKKQLLEWVLSMNQWDGYSDPSLLLRRILPDNENLNNQRIIESVWANSEQTDLLKFRMFNQFPECFTDHEQLYYGLREIYTQVPRKERKKFRNNLSVKIEDHIESEWVSDTLPVFQSLSDWQNATTIQVAFSNVLFYNGGYKIHVAPDFFYPEESQIIDKRSFQELNDFRNMFSDDDFISMTKSDLGNEQSLDISKWIDRIEYEKYRRPVVSAVPSGTSIESSDPYIKNYLQESALHEYVIQFKLDHVKTLCIGGVNNKHSKEDSLLIPININHKNLQGAILWIQPEKATGNAVYVFKGEMDYIDIQVQQIGKQIATSRNLKSLLISRQDHGLTELLKRKLGYVGRIKYNRNAESKSNSWKDKLNLLFAYDVPEKLSIEEETQLENLLKSDQSKPTRALKLGKESLNKQGKMSITSVDIGNETQEESTKILNEAQKERLANILDVANKRLEELNNQFLKIKLDGFE